MSRFHLRQATVFEQSFQSSSSPSHNSSSFTLFILHKILITYLYKAYFSIMFYLVGQVTDNFRRRCTGFSVLSLQASSAFCRNMTFAGLDGGLFALLRELIHPAVGFQLTSKDISIKTDQSDTSQYNKWHYTLYMFAFLRTIIRQFVQTSKKSVLRVFTLNFSEFSIISI